MLIDFHTHCFADSIYEKAIKSLVALSDGYTPVHNGSLNGLVGSMDECGIDISVVHSIATKATQTKIINDWVISIQSDRIIPFGTIHQDYDDWENEITRLKKAGIKGIKFHPDYQGFFVDDRKMYSIYEKVADEGMIALFHCGVDIAFPNLVRNPPNRFKNVLIDIPQLTVVGAHMGGHRMFEEVSEILTPMNLYLDTSFAHYVLGDKKFEALIRKHGVERILFGSDSPWDNPAEQANIIDSLGFTSVEKDMIFYKNANKLLDI